PEIVGRGQESARRQVRAHRSEEGTAFREESDDLELRVLARARVGPDPPQQRAENAPPRAVHATEKLGGHRIRLARAACELRVWRLGVRGEPEVTLDRVEQVRGVIGPACDAEVDLSHGAMPISREERAEALLQPPGECADPITRSELV